MRWLACCWLFCWLLLPTGWAQSPSLPAKPTRYVSDRSLTLDEPTIAALDAKLAEFERATSNQIVVAIFANLPTGAEVAQYSTQVFRAWQVGQAEKDNGVVLFVYKNDRKLFIATGRGLEGALPDVLCKQIIETEIVPRFRENDFPGGVQAGVEAILAATQGEYQGTGRTAGDSRGEQGSSLLPFLILGLVFASMVFRAKRGGRDVLVNGRGFNTFGGGWIVGGGGGGGGWGGGGGGGGGFSGGGGDSGGGGAGGSW